MSIDYATLLETVATATGAEPVEANAGGTTTLVVDLPDGRVLTIGDVDGPLIVRDAQEQTGPSFVDPLGFVVQSYPDRDAHDDGEDWTDVAAIEASLPLLTVALRAAAQPGATPGPRVKRVRVTLEVYVPADVSDEDVHAAANAAFVQLDEPRTADDERIPTLTAATMHTSIDRVAAP